MLNWNVEEVAASFKERGRRPSGSTTSTPAARSLSERNSKKESTTLDPIRCRIPERYRDVCSTKGTKIGCNGKSFVKLSRPEVNSKTRPSFSFFSTSKGVPSVSLAATRAPVVSAATAK